MVKWVALTGITVYMGLAIGIGQWHSLALSNLEQFGVSAAILWNVSFSCLSILLLLTVPVIYISYQHQEQAIFLPLSRFAIVSAGPLSFLLACLGLYLDAIDYSADCAPVLTT